MDKCKTILAHIQNNPSEKNISQLVRVAIARAFITAHDAPEGQKEMAEILDRDNTYVKEHIIAAIFSEWTNAYLHDEYK